MWTPDQEGEYIIIATFEGSESYWRSYAKTAIRVGPAPAPTVQIEAEAFTLTITEIALVAAVAIAVVLGITGYLEKGKHLRFSLPFFIGSKASEE